MPSPDPASLAAEPRSAAPGQRSLDRQIWAVAWPAMLALLVTTFNDLVDIAIVGSLGRDVIAAYGYARQCVHVVELMVQAVGIGCVALMSRAIGAARPDTARRVFAGSMALSIGVALVVFGVVSVAPRPVLRLLDARPDVLELAVPYFRLTTAATVLMAVSFTFDSGFRANKRTRAPLLAALSMLAVKPLVTYGFVHGAVGLPRLGLLGAGFGNLAEHAAALAVYLGVSRVLAREGLCLSFGVGDVTGSWTTMRHVARVALPAAGERLVMSAALMTYFAILSSYGTGAVAAYSIGVRLLAASWVPGLGFAVAASTFVGQALGARDSEGARAIARRSVTLAVAMMLGLGVACWLLRAEMARAFTSDPTILSGLVPFLLMLGLAQPFMGAHFTLGGVLRGAGDTVTPLVGAALGNWLFRVPLALLFSRVLGLDLVWVWSALIADHLVRMLWNLRAFRRGQWAQRLGGSPHGELVMAPSQVGAVVKA